jgi:hypothetical protein
MGEPSQHGVLEPLDHQEAGRYLLLGGKPKGKDGGTVAPGEAPEEERIRASAAAKERGMDDG